MKYINCPYHYTDHWCMHEFLDLSTHKLTHWQTHPLTHSITPSLINWHTCIYVASRFNITNLFFWDNLTFHSWQPHWEGHLIKYQVQNCQCSTSDFILQKYTILECFVNISWRSLLKVGYFEPEVEIGIAN